MKYLALLTLLLTYSILPAQSLQVLTTGTATNIRGLSVVSNKVLWVSGNNGTVGHSFDGGLTFKWLKVHGFDSTDFRDIEAFSTTEAIIMGIGEPAYILKTQDGGNSWKLVYENKTKGIFLDAMEFWNTQSGIVIGDPIDGHFFFARTFDGGNTWQNLPTTATPTAYNGEACFASSGTNIRTLGKAACAYVSGGLKSRLYYKNKVTNLPILQGTESTGANSLAISKNLKNLIIIGGDFTKKNDTTSNCALSFDGGLTISLPITYPSGYRSCVAYITHLKAITCGLNGVDVSADNGLHWKAISTQSYNVVSKAKQGTAVYLAGAKGTVSKFVE